MTETQTKALAKAIKDAEANVTWASSLYDAADKEYCSSIVSRRKHTDYNDVTSHLYLTAASALGKLKNAEDVLRILMDIKNS